ncbi:MAG: amidase [Hyphomicrobiaceae bacterium]
MAVTKNRELIELSATEAVGQLAKGEVSPLELVDAAEARAHDVEPSINALPTTCFERAREHAKALMRGERRERQDEPGWLGGLPVAIKDLTDVAGVRTTYGSPIFRDHVPDTSHPVVERIESLGGIIVAKSNTPEFGAGGSTFNEVFGRTHNPWNTALTPGGSTGGGAAALAAGEVWLAHGTDHAGSLRRPATYCSVIGLRPSAGRITRGFNDNLFSAASVHGPMARTVPDVALFLDTMAGLCPTDPLTFCAPAVSFTKSLQTAEPPRRAGFTADFSGSVPVDSETREICAAAAKSFEALGTKIEEPHLSLEGLEEAFLALRSQHYVVAHAERLETHRDAIKPDIIWNTEIGLNQPTRKLGNAERSRAALYRQFALFFKDHEILITPGASTPAFDVELRMPTQIDGKKLENYVGASLITGAISMLGLPAIALPCGFDRFGRPVGLQLIGRHRGEAALLAAAHHLMEQTGWHRSVPIRPRSGMVPSDK